MENQQIKDFPEKIKKTKTVHPVLYNFTSPLYVLSDNHVYLPHFNMLIKNQQIICALLLSMYCSQHYC